MTINALNCGPTVLIEIYPAAFEMEEILYEVWEHSSGLNAGRWDYIFSVLKQSRARGQELLLPDRAQITMTVPFMHAFCELLGPSATGVAHMPSVAWPPSFPAGTQWSTRLRSARSRRTRPSSLRGVRRIVGGAPRHGCGVRRGRSPRCSMGDPTSFTSFARTFTSPPNSCWTSPRPPAR